MPGGVAQFTVPDEALQRGTYSADTSKYMATLERSGCLNAGQAEGRPKTKLAVGAEASTGLSA